VQQLSEEKSQGKRHCLATSFSDEVNSPHRQCDFQQPFCLRCAKAKITCTGYSKDTVFVNRTALTPTATAATALSALRTYRSPSHDSYGLDAGMGLELQISELMSPSSPPCELRARAIRLIEKLYLPREYNGSGDISQSCCAWLPSILNLTGPSRALDMSLLSFCTTMLYATRHKSGSLEKSLDLYNSALQSLRADIERPEIEFGEEIIAAIILVSMTEVCYDF
jgi:hypothetical protein